MDYVSTCTFSTLEGFSWHGKEGLPTSGGLFDPNTPLPQILQDANMDYDVYFGKVGIELPDGSFQADPKRTAIMRPPTAWAEGHKRLRIVGNRYQPIQNMQLAEALDPLTVDWKPAGAMILKDGMITIIELTLPEFNVGGHPNETHKQYLLVSDNKDNGKLQYGLTITRVVCWNTYSFAMSSSAMSSIPHTHEAMMELDFRVNLQKAVIETAQQEQEFLNKLFTTPVREIQVENLLDELFPDIAVPRKAIMEQEAKTYGLEDHKLFEDVGKQNKSRDSKQARQVQLRDAVRTLFGKFNDEQPYAKDTAYAFLNAVTETTSHWGGWAGTPEKQIVGQILGQQADTNQRVRNLLAKVV